MRRYVRFVLVDMNKSDCVALQLDKKVLRDNSLQSEQKAVPFCAPGFFQRSPVTQYSLSTIFCLYPGLHAWV
jgi:hypothetical protein